MKKIIALALALIMVLSMGTVAFAKATDKADKCVAIVGNWDKTDAGLVAPGTVIEFSTQFDANGNGEADYFDDWKISEVDFTTKELQGASLIDSVKITKEKDAVRLTVKESYSMAEEDAKAVEGKITLTTDFDADADGKKDTRVLWVAFTVNNEVKYIDGGRKASEAETITDDVNTVTVVEEAGYVTFTNGELTGTAKVAKGDKVYLNSKVNLKTADPDEYDALVAAFGGEDYEGIVEMYTFETEAFEACDFRYDAWEEDPHFFYAWDGEKLSQIEAKYDDDEDVDDYVFTAAAAGTIVVCDEEVVLAAEETKNPDTGANDVVGVAAALAVVSLVAAGAVSLKK